MTFELMTVGFVGFLTTISVFVGAYLGLNYAIPEKVLSSILAFAAGSLIAALAIELSFEGAEALVKHGFGIRASWFNMAMGFGVGAALYYTASVFLESKGAPIRLPHMLFNAKNSRIAADEKIVSLSRSPLFSHRSALTVALRSRLPSSAISPKASPWLSVAMTWPFGSVSNTSPSAMM